MLKARNTQEWNIVKFDSQGRTILTGIFNSGTAPGINDRSAMQVNVNSQGKNWKTRISVGNGYTADTYPKTWLTTLALTYFDDYNFPNGNPYPYAGIEVSNMTRGFATGSKVNVLGTTNMLWTVNYYNEDGRVVKTFKQHYKGNTLVAGNYDEVTNTYDFTGAVLSTTRSHKVGGSEALK
ncbi:MAG: hypothetical protein H7282_13515, partial [Cytophagaceae bacterium]|nr:hypothetical protein [Cytophagaceae bacterium]